MCVRLILTSLKFTVLNRVASGGFAAQLYRAANLIRNALKQRYHKALPCPRQFHSLPNHRYRARDNHSPKFGLPSVFQIIQMRCRVYSRCKGKTVVYHIHTHGWHIWRD